MAMFSLQILQKSIQHQITRKTALFNWFNSEIKMITNFELWVWKVILFQTQEKIISLNIFMYHTLVTVGRRGGNFWPARRYFSSRHYCSASASQSFPELWRSINYTNIGFDRATVKHSLLNRVTDFDFLPKITISWWKIL